jgi:hypothetical protein
MTGQLSYLRAQQRIADLNQTAAQARQANAMKRPRPRASIRTLTHRPGGASPHRAHRQLPVELLAEAPE